MTIGIKVNQRLAALEDHFKAEQVKTMQQVLQLMNEVIELRTRVDALEAKRGPGRPPKNG